MNSAKPLLLFIAMLLVYYVQAQLTVTAFASRDTICKGESVQLGFAISNPDVISCIAAPAICSGNDITDSLMGGNGFQEGGINVYAKTPYGNYYKGYRMQYLYTAQELLAEFGGAGYIKNLGWLISNFNSIAALQNFKIKIGCLPPDSITISTWKTDLGAVYNPPYYSPVPGWNSHDFFQPYYWDGVSNLVIEVSHYNTFGQGNLVNLMAYNDLPGTVLYAADNFDITNDSSIYPTIWNERPKMKMRMCYADSIPQSTIKWLDNDSANIISGSTSANPVIYPTQSGTYQVQIIQNGDTALSNPVTVIVNNNIIPSIIPSYDTLYCFDDSISMQLNVNGIFSAYQWSNGSVDSSIIATQPGNYTVTTTDILGCVLSTSPFTINQLPPVKVTVDDGIPCFHETLVMLEPTYAYSWNDGAIGQDRYISQTASYIVTATYNHCAHVINIGLIQSADTLSDVVFTILESPNGEFFYITVQHSGYYEYTVEGTTDTASGDIISLTSVYNNQFQIFMSEYCGKYIRLLTTNNICVDTSDWQLMPQCIETNIRSISANLYGQA